MKYFGDIYRGKKVLVTGHTGFKGSWLSAWLLELGAEVHGLSLSPKNLRDHFKVLNLRMNSRIENICNGPAVAKIVSEIQPDIIFHLAAQSLVLKSYQYPSETFDVNVTGTSNLLDAVRKTTSVKAVVVVTSDKCYKPGNAPHSEDDELGGDDPYSASKACQELVTAAYRNSFFTTGALIATARAGNIIGGGDWAENRLLPDIMRSIEMQKSVLIRNPRSVRPWQFVLDPLAGYLLLGKKLLEEKKNNATAFNFGPAISEQCTVSELIDLGKSYLSFNTQVDNKSYPHESPILRLDCSKAQQELQWRPLFDAKRSISQTFDWYREYVSSGKIITSQQIAEYCTEARNRSMSWTL